VRERNKNRGGHGPLRVEELLRKELKQRNGEEDSRRKTRTCFKATTKNLKEERRKRAREIRKYLPNDFS